MLSIHIVRFGHRMGQAFLPIRYPGKRRLIAEAHHHLRKRGYTQGLQDITFFYPHSLKKTPHLRSHVDVGIHTHVGENILGSFQIFGRWTLPTLRHLNDTKITLSLETGEWTIVRHEEINLDTNIYLQLIRNKLLLSSAAWACALGLPALGLIAFAPVENSALSLGVSLPLLVVALSKTIQFVRRLQS